MKIKTRYRINSLVLNKLCIVLLALTPILQHYKGLYVNASVTILLIVMMYVLVKFIILNCLSVKSISVVFPLILWFFYKLVDHGTSINEFGQAVVFSVIVMAIACKIFDTGYFIKVVTTISIIACIIIILQYISYYIFHYHIQCVLTALLLDKSDQWVKAAETGLSSISGRVSRLYRPSAFFLEPSHMFLYVFPILMYKELSPDFNKKGIWQCIVLNIGLVFTTSGMGILTVIGTGALYLLKKGSEDGKLRFKNLLKTHNILFLILVVFILIFMYVKIPFFQNSIARITSSGKDYTNAIDGRIGASSRLLKSLSGMNLLIGVSDSLAGIKYNMSGFAKAMYCYGIIGTIISYIFYVLGAINLKNQYKWIAIIVIITSYFSSHTHSTFFMLYMTFLFVDGYQRIKSKL